MNTIKRIPEDDIGAFIDIARNAYPSMKITSEEDRDKAKERFVKMQREDSKVNFYGFYREDKILGGMLFHDFDMTLLSTRTKAGGVGFVAVDFLHKKEKIAKEMIHFFLKHYKEMGAYMTLLYPFRPDFYKNMGFGFGTKMNQYRVKPGSLTRGNSKDNIFFLTSNDKTEILDCYKRFASKRNGMIDKSQRELEGIFKNPDNRVIGYRTEGKIEGYMVFTFKKGENDSFLTNDMFIWEFIYESREALSQMLTFMNSQRDQIRHIIMNTQDEYFHHLMADPKNGIDNIIPHVYHESNVQGVGLMYRVIDIKGIFTVLSNHNFGNQNCKLKINISDSFFEENDGSYFITFREGRPEINETKDFEVEISMDISDFSSMLMGVINFESLYDYGLANIANVEHVDIVDKLFSTSKKPMCTTGF